MSFWGAVMCGSRRAGHAPGSTPTSRRPRPNPVCKPGLKARECLCVFVLQWWVFFCTATSLNVSNVVHTVNVLRIWYPLFANYFDKIWTNTHLCQWFWYQITLVVCDDTFFFWTHWFYGMKQEILEWVKRNTVWSHTVLTICFGPTPCEKLSRVSVTVHVFEPHSQTTSIHVRPGPHSRWQDGVPRNSCMSIHSIVLRAKRRQRRTSIISNTLIHLIPTIYLTSTT